MRHVHFHSQEAEGFALKMVEKKQQTASTSRFRFLRFSWREVARGGRRPKKNPTRDAPQEAIPVRFPRDYEFPGIQSLIPLSRDLGEHFSRCREGT